MTTTPATPVQADGMPNGISVAMATYNGAKFLREQLHSIAAQHYIPGELVVTDDASTDATIDILQEFAATAPFPVHIHRNQSRLGYRANFIRAMSLCRMDVVALCDQDDVWEAEKTQVAMQVFTDPEVVLFFHNAWLIDDTGGVIGPANILTLPPRNAPLSFYPMVNPFGFSIVFRRKLTRFADHWLASVDNVEPKNRMAHDQWIFFLASASGVVSYSDARLVQYRQHGGNAYGWKNSRAGLARRLALMRRNSSSDYMQFASAAAARGRVLRAILQAAAEVSLSKTELDEMRTCANFYENLSRRLTLRAEIYMGQHFHHRVLAFSHLLGAGAYARGSSWNIGPKAMVKDLLLGIVCRPLLILQTDPQAQAAEHLRRDLKVSSS